MNLDTTNLDPGELRAAFACVPQGVTAVCARDNTGTPQGIAASTFTPVSLDPPLISLCVANTSTTWPKLRTLPRIGVSVLAHTQNDICRALAARTDDRFVGIEHHTTDEGAVLLHGAVLWMDCTLEAEMPAGDHQIALLRIQAITAEPARDPLVFHGSRFRHLAPAGY
ncbi:MULTISPECIES: flavin reductase family protein [unclassified Streptomyces]|uniref:flavin reductase family protein n=1 Tax=unclassified Streptomyces TaxID=2593676 RepID=UPI0035DBD959